MDRIEKTEDGGACPHDNVLQEYALERTSPQSTQRVKSHLNSCPSCVLIVEELRKEAEVIRNGIILVEEQAPGPCPDDEVLALYLDKASDKKKLQETEEHLSYCGKCRTKLIEIFRDVQELIDPTVDVNIYEGVRKEDSQRIEFAQGATAIEKMRDEAAKRKAEQECLSEATKREKGDIRQKKV